MRRLISSFVFVSFCASILLLDISRTRTYGDEKSDSLHIHATVSNLKRLELIINELIKANPTANEFEVPEELRRLHISRLQRGSGCIEVIFESLPADALPIAVFSPQGDIRPYLIETLLSNHVFFYKRINSNWGYVVFDFGKPVSKADIERILQPK